jgi:hypothetical protein
LSLGFDSRVLRSPRAFTFSSLLPLTIALACASAPAPGTPRATVSSAAASPATAKAPSTASPAEARSRKGKPCTESGKVECIDTESSLRCDGATWRAVACHGPNGCRDAVCDDSFASEGDACFSDASSESYACTVDRTALLICRDNKFERERNCKGPERCTVRGNGDQIFCDTSIADAGDACSPASLACATDAKMKLRCADGKFVEDNTCRGPKGCLMKEHAVYCDETIAMEGDVCDTAGEVTCGMDGKTTLVCKSGKFVKKRDCKGQDGCSFRGTTLYCADQ